MTPGTRVAGQLELVACIGTGAMGSVWRAKHLTLKHEVAIKLLSGSRSAEARLRFDREAKLAARLGEASVHVTRVSDHGTLEDGTPYLVMELLHGEGLDRVLARKGRLPLDIAAEITRQLARALGVAHAAGVVHRDLKPANVFLCESDEGIVVKLLDFGIAKIEGQTMATRDGAILGTPSFMSPEQISGSRVDARTDLFALAGIVYRMVTGRAPFGSGELAEMAMRILATEPTPPSELAPDLPFELDAFMAKALAKKPCYRFADANALAEALSSLVGLPPSGAFRVVAAAEPAVETPTVDVAPSRPNRRRAVTVWAAAAMLAGCFASFGAFRSKTVHAATTAVTLAPLAPPPAFEAAVEKPTVEKAPVMEVVTTQKEAPKPVVAQAEEPDPYADQPAIAAPPPAPPAQPTDTWHKRDEM